MMLVRDLRAESFYIPSGWIRAIAHSPRPYAGQQVRRRLILERGDLAVFAEKVRLEDVIGRAATIYRPRSRVGSLRASEPIVRTAASTCEEHR
jgi:hypothetical protein